MIKLKELLKEAAPGLTAINAKTGRRTPFKSSATYDAAIKAGTHTPLPSKRHDITTPKDREKEAPASDKNYDDTSYWKDNGDNKKSDYWGDKGSFKPELTSDRLNKIETALVNDLKLEDNGFTTTRESSEEWEGPMEIISDTAGGGDHNCLSISSANNDGKFSISLTNQDGEPLYNDKDFGSLTGNTNLTPQQAYKMAKVLMGMPEMQKLIKGEMSVDDFKSVHDKIKSSFTKK